MGLLMVSCVLVACAGDGGSNLSGGATEGETEADSGGTSMGSVTDMPTTTALTDGPTAGSMSDSASTTASTGMTSADETMGTGDTEGELCGNGLIDAGEECDDWNDEDDD